MTLAEELTSLLNKYSAENGSNTPDYILAAYLLTCLGAFNAAVQARQEWYGKTADSIEALSQSTTTAHPIGPCGDAACRTCHKSAAESPTTVQQEPIRCTLPGHPHGGPCRWNRDPYAYEKEKT